MSWSKQVKLRNCITSKRTMNALLSICFAFACLGFASAKPVQHFVFFGMDRESLPRDSAFLRSKAFAGAQVAYSWRQLEHGRDEYDFSIIREDLALLASHGKKLFIQLQDVTFSPNHIPVPEYLLRDPRYNGGADKQYHIRNGDEEHAVTAGWATRRWDPQVQERFHKLLGALGREFDGHVEGINIAESSVEFGETGKLHPKGFSHTIYRDAIIANMTALKRVFPRSVALQYANFMPGEWRPIPAQDRGYLTAVYRAARTLGVGVGGPDLLPHRPGQVKGAYPLIREVAGAVPTGIAVQDGNLEEVDPATKKRVTVMELIDFATQYLQVDYIFWGRQEPYYSKELMPFLHK